MALIARIVLAVAFLAGLVSPSSAHGEAGWTWPLRGEIVTKYRNGDDPYAGGQHRGIDIAGRVGAPVVAAAAGRVVFAGTAGWSGVAVTVRTGGARYDTSYLHLSSSAVREGEELSRGERIGAVGTTGRRSVQRPHLHFSVRDAGSRHAYHDPLAFLPAPPAGGRPDSPRGAPAPVPAPVRTAPDAAPAPRVVRVPAARRVPAGRRAPLPEGRRHPLPGRAPQPVPSPGPAGAPALAPSPARASAPAGRGAAHPRDAPALGSAPHGAPAQSPQSARPAAGGEPGAARGPDLGWALACAGLLLAAAFVGGTDQGRAAAGRGRARLAAVLRPLTGRT